MKTYLDNLRPFERRVVVAVAVVLFIVLNVWFVFPHFSDWTKVQDRMWDAQRKLSNYQKEIDRMNSYSNLVRQLEGQGLEVPAEDQANHFATTVQSQAAANRVNILQNSKITTKTNQFFLEMTQGISVQGGEQQLVDFLFSLGRGDSLIRARGLSLHPDPPRQQLSASVTLVATYQKKVPVKPAALSVQPATARALAAGARPATPSPNPVIPAGRSR
jgi:hypothetical protein